MPMRAWLPCAIALLASACARVPSEALVAPTIPNYAAEVQARAAEELDRLGPPCPRDRITPGCSAVRLMMDDYGELRARIRAVGMAQKSWWAAGWPRLVDGFNHLLQSLMTFGVTRLWSGSSRPSLRNGTNGEFDFAKPSRE